VYKDTSAAERVSLVAGIAAFLTLASIVVAVFAIWSKPPWAQNLVLAMAALWGVGGPMWFFYEYFFIYRKFGALDSWEQFKHGQHVSGAIWIALTATLTVIGTSDLLDAGNDSYRCELDPSAGNAEFYSSAKVHLTCTPK
jgi:hypothetical protein